MSKQISPLDILIKTSLNSFLVETKNESFLIVPGVYFEMPGKFFLYCDVAKTILEIIAKSGQDTTIIDINQFKEALAPKAIDFNKLFMDLENKLENKDLGLIVNTVSNENLPQPSTTEINESKSSNNENNTQIKKPEQSQNKTQPSTEKPTKTSHIKTQQRKYYTKENYNNKTYSKPAYKKRYNKQSKKSGENEL